MQDLTVIGVENDSLLVATRDGELKFTLAIDEVLQSRIRGRAMPEGTSRKISPREIQTHIRAGMSAADVASVTGAAIEYVERFEGPVLAERQYVVDSALAVSVHTASDNDPLGLGPTFGTVIRERLAGLGAVDERWASWKEQNADWIVKLSFTADEIDHDARWQFDPKRQTLSPLNSEARTLSQQEDTAPTLIPRLRAVGVEEKKPDESRFDSGAFSVDVNLGDTAPHSEVIPYGRTSELRSPVSLAAIKRADPEPQDTSEQTEDLLEALRRRRGEREAANYAEELELPELSTGNITLVDIPLDDFAEELELQPKPAVKKPNSTRPQNSMKAAKNGRASMPSWDEIVFGTKTEDE
jgi:hypothetical protein